MGETTVNFTKRSIEALPLPPEGKRSYFNDAQVKGLQLALTAKGTRTFVVYKRVDGKPTRVRLGNYPDMSPAVARNEAYKILGEISKGENPVARRKAERARTVTLKEAFEAYTSLKKANLKPKTLYDYQKLMDSAFREWHGKRLVELTKAQVQRKHQALSTNSGPSYANYAMRLLKAVFNFAQHQYEDAQGQSLIPANPVDILSRTRTWNRTKPRDRYIQPHQLKAWFSAVMTLKEEGPGSPADTVADYLLLMLFTGLRRQEAARLKWEDISFQARTLTVRDTKNHLTHTLPLSEYLQNLLKTRFENRFGNLGETDSENLEPGPGVGPRNLEENLEENLQNRFSTGFVFPGKGGEGFLIEPRNHIKRVSSLAGVEFTIHDLRRTFSMTVAELDINAYKQKRLLNHKTMDVTAGYTPIDLEQLRDPMERVTEKLLQGLQ